MPGDYGTLTSLADQTNQVKQVMLLVPTLEPRMTPLLNAIDTGEPVTGERGILNWHEKRTRNEAGTTGADQDAVETQLTLATGEGIHIGKGDVILIGTEYQLITTMAADVAVVVRGVLGSTAASSSSGAAWTRFSNTFPEDANLEAAGIQDTAPYYNYCQHFVKTFQETYAAGEVDRYGNKTRLQDSLINALEENRKDLNKALFDGVRYLFDAADVAGSMGGIHTFIPQRADGAFSSDSITRLIINTLLEEIQTTSGALRSGYTIVSTFPMKQAIIQPYFSINSYNRDADEKKAGTYIETIVTPYGEVRLLADACQTTGRISIVRLEDIKVHALGKRVWQMEEQAVNKLATQKTQFGIYTCSVVNPSRAIYATGLSEAY